MNNEKEYASGNEAKYQFTMKSNGHPLIRKCRSFMSMSANYLFAQVNEHTQMTAKAGIKTFGDQALTAMLNKYKQLNAGPMPGKHVFGCIDPTTITPEEKHKALEAVNLIKRKGTEKSKVECAQTGVNRKDISSTERQYHHQRYL